MNDLIISNLPIEGVSDTELAAAFDAVLVEHKGAIASIHQSMVDADEAYRKYLSPDYVPEEQEAKKDRATLNKAEKNIQEKFADLKTAYEKPLSKIEANIKSIRNAIKEASGEVDGAAKKYEEKRKTAKQQEIEKYFLSKKFELVPLDRIFDLRWLNKGYEIPDVRRDIDAKIAVIYQDIKTLEVIPDYGMTVKASYLNTLNMAAALREVETLKANAEKLAQEKAERQEREHREAIEANQKEQRQEARGGYRSFASIAQDRQTAALAAEALGIPEPEVKHEDPPLYEMTLKFIETEAALIRLKELITANNIAYEKIGNLRRKQ